MDETDVKQATFEGWAVVEMMGHRKEIGFVTTQAFGQAVLFRVDVPELPEREFTLESPEYAGGRYCPTGTKVKRQAKRRAFLSRCAAIALRDQPVLGRGRTCSNRAQYLSPANRS